MCPVCEQALQQDPSFVDWIEMLLDPVQKVLTWHDSTAAQRRLAQQMAANAKSKAKKRSRNKKSRRAQLSSSASHSKRPSLTPSTQASTRIKLLCRR